MSAAVSFDILYANACLDAIIATVNRMEELYKKNENGVT